MRDAQLGARSRGRLRGIALGQIASSNVPTLVWKEVRVAVINGLILGTVLDELERRNLNTALVTLCIGVGMGTATIIERV